MKKLMKLALIVGGIAFAAKLVSSRKAEWGGLTELEIRAKLDARLPEQIPDDKRTAIADMVVSKMRERGVLRDEAKQTTHPGGAAETDSDSGGAEAE